MNQTAHRTPRTDLERAGDRMQRETYERAGAQARSLSVLRKDNPFVRPSSNAEEQQRLQTLAEHWWRGWDTWTSYIRPRGRALDPNRR